MRNLSSIFIMRDKIKLPAKCCDLLPNEKSLKKLLFPIRPFEKSCFSLLHNEFSFKQSVFFADLKVSPFISSQLLNINSHNLNFAREMSRGRSGVKDWTQSKPTMELTEQSAPNKRAVLKGCEGRCIQNASAHLRFT